MPIRAKKQKAEINKMFFFTRSPNKGIKFDLYIDGARLHKQRSTEEIIIKI
jgi:hypothetical protein